MQENRSEPDFKQGRTLYVQKSTANLLQWCFFMLPKRNDKSLELLQIQQNKGGAGCGTRTHDLGIMRTGGYVDGF
jgi:hypothetical protein